MKTTVNKDLPAAGSFADKIRLVTGRNYFNPKKVEFYLPPTDTIGKDGEGHIRVDRIGETELGKLLSLDSPFQFKHYVYGNFVNVRSFWAYITSQTADDRLRVLRGIELNIESRKHGKVRVSNFKVLIADAVWQYVTSQPVLVKMILESTLPFDSYACHGRKDGIKIRRNESFWYCAILEEVRRALKEERAPDFSDFMDKEGGCVYSESITPDIISNHVRFKYQIREITDTEKAMFERVMNKFIRKKPNTQKLPLNKGKKNKPDPKEVVPFTTNEDGEVTVNPDAEGLVK